MRAKIAGFGWVTPLGVGLDEVWEKMEAGREAAIDIVVNPETGRALPCAPVPRRLVEGLSRTPRMRRSSPISYFAATAGLNALENAGISMSPRIAARTALVFAVSSGGVLYTRKFYEQVVKHGASAASPLLFPETVYNAPASHLAAQLGIDGASYTLVGDCSVGLEALKFAEQLLAADDLHCVLVVGSEELDWVLCEAYREWRLTRTASSNARGALLAEGAAAVVVSREGQFSLSAVHPGVPFFRQSQAASAIQRAFSETLRNKTAELVIGGANGTFVDYAERSAINSFCPNVECLFPKGALGEALGAGALMQVVVAALAMQHRNKQSALVSSMGPNHQASCALIELKCAEQEIA